MTAIDHTLLFQARKLMNGANAHRIKTLIFCYEASLPDSDMRKHYERLLRKFVAAEQETHCKPGGAHPPCRIVSKRLDMAMGNLELHP